MTSDIFSWCNFQQKIVVRAKCAAAAEKKSARFNLCQRWNQFRTWFQKLRWKEIEMWELRHHLHSPAVPYLPQVIFGHGATTFDLLNKTRVTQTVCREMAGITILAATCLKWPVSPNKRAFVFLKTERVSDMSKNFEVVDKVVGLNPCWFWFNKTISSVLKEVFQVSIILLFIFSKAEVEPVT